MSSLNLANVAIGMSMSRVALDFSISQNCFGLCLSISGSENCIYALLSLQVWMNSDIARRVCKLDLPNWRCARLSSRLVVAHLAVNHGARCLSHLLGLATERRVEITSSTPASVAYSSRNCSTRAALTSFVAESSSIMA
jgi:hypothetical protein